MAFPNICSTFVCLKVWDVGVTSRASLSKFQFSIREFDSRLFHCRVITQSKLLAYRHSLVSNQDTRYHNEAFLQLVGSGVALAMRYRAIRTEGLRKVW